MIYAINYDLKQPGQNYNKLHETIKSCGAWWHHLDSTWLVDSDMTAQSIWNKLSRHTDKNDHILIVGISRDYAGWLPQEAWDWIKSRITKMAA